MIQKSITELINDTKSQDSEIRRNALIALGDSGNSRALPIIMNYAKNYNSDENEIAINVLAKFINNDDVRAVFIKLLKKSDVYYTVATIAIAYFADDIEAEPTLLSAIKKKSIDKYVDYCASIALARMGKVTSEYRDMITREEIDTKYESLFVFNNTPERYRQARSYAFEAAKYVPSSDPYYNDLYATLVKVMTDENQEDDYRRSATRAIRSSCPESIVGGLVSYYSGNPDSIYAKLCIMSYVQKRKAGEALTGALLGIINHRDEEVRQFATVNLAEIGSDAYVDALYDGIESGDEDVAVKCLVSMTKVGTEYSVQRLKEAVDVLPESMSYHVRVALANVGDEGAIEYLRDNKDSIMEVFFHRTEDGEIDLDNVLPWDIKAILATGSEDILGTLMQTDYSGHDEHEESFLHGLSYYDYADVKTVVAKRLKHKNRDIRIAAVKIIMDNSDDDDLELIKPLTRYRTIGHTDDDDKVRCVIADNIGGFRRDDMVQILTDMINSDFILEDEQWDLRSHCADALLKNNVVEAVPLLKSMIDEEVEEHRYKKFVVVLHGLEKGRASEVTADKDKVDSPKMEPQEDAQKDDATDQNKAQVVEVEESASGVKEVGARQRDHSESKRKGSKGIVLMATVAILCLIVVAGYFVLGVSDHSDAKKKNKSSLVDAVGSTLDRWNDGLRSGSGYAIASCYVHKTTSVDQHAKNLDRAFGKWGNINVNVVDVNIREVNPYKAEVSMRRVIEFSDRRSQSEASEHNWVRFTKYAHESLVLERVNNEWKITYERPTNWNTSNLYYFDANTNSWCQRTGSKKYVDVGSIPENPWK